EAQHDPGAVMVRIALGTGVQLGGHRAHDALSHAGGARIGLGVETDAVVRNHDHEVFAVRLQLDVNGPGAVRIGVFDGVHHQLVDDDADRHRAVRVDLDR